MDHRLTGSKPVRWPRPSWSPLQWRRVCLFVCFNHRLFTPASTPKGVDFCLHSRLYSRLKGSRAPSSGRFIWLRVLVYIACIYSVCHASNVLFYNCAVFLLSYHLLNMHLISLAFGDNKVDWIELNWIELNLCEIVAKTYVVEKWQYYALIQL